MLISSKIIFYWIINPVISPVVLISFLLPGILFPIIFIFICDWLVRGPRHKPDLIIIKLILAVIVDINQILNKHSDEEEKDEGDINYNHPSIVPKVHDEISN